MRSVDQISGDRRAGQRFAVEMPLRFRYRTGASEGEGSGTTLDLGRKGIRFASDHAPPVDAEVELSIEWPFLLQNVCPLELRVRGRVLRSDDRGTVIRVVSYEFRTCGVRSFDQGAVIPANLSIVA